MIVALSTFRVRNGREQDVRDAFVRRPRLVDRAPGFLGLDVFTEASDPATFHLLTRWTCVEAFEAWHRSEAHHQSHRGIPAGLKLDPAATRLLTLERIEPEGARLSDWELLTSDAAPLLAGQLAASLHLGCLVADASRVVRACNAGLLRRLGRSSDEVLGRPLETLLVEGDAALVARRMEAGQRADDERVLLNFVDRAGAVFTFEAILDVQPDRVLILGESPARDDQAQEELVRLNAELAVLSRESVRRTREAERARAALAEALKDLEESHWHLRRIQEVLPACLGCGRVKAGAEWQTLLDYMKQNAPFLSHGYCPECARRTAAEWGLRPREE